MANIKIELDYMIRDGMDVVFKAPCDCSEITSLIVYYHQFDGTVASETFTLKDAHNNNLDNVNNLFLSGAYVKIILDTTNKYAYVQNTDTNAYLEAQLDDRLSKSKGGTVTGALTLNKIILTNNVNYGTTLPSTGTIGQLFFLKV